MDQSTYTRPSGIPRPSRLPVPVAGGLRSAASRENLQQSRLSTINSPRLRSTPSRDQLSSSTRQRTPATPAKPRNISTDTIVRTPTNQQVQRKSSRNDLFRKPSQPALREHHVQAGGAGKTLAPAEVADISPVDNMQQSDVEPPREHHPSLSERTMETLQSIPSSPAGRRRSSFFNGESPMRASSFGDPSSRPGSSYDPSMRPPSRSVSSRPSSSAGGPKQSNVVDFRASTNTFRPPQSTIQVNTPLKRPSTIKSLKTPSSIRNATAPAEESSKVSSSGFGSSLRQRSPSPVKSTAGLPKTLSGSKTLSSRPLKPRASLNGLFRKPSMPILDQSSDLDRIGFVPKKTATAPSNSSSDPASPPSKSSKGPSPVTSASGDEATPRKSSLALRDQIAKAKAAKRAAAAKQSNVPIVPTGTFDFGVGVGAAEESNVPVIATGTFDFGLSDDPFNQGISQASSKGLLRKRIAAARTDGRLNVAAMGFKEIPEEVMTMYESVGDSSWAEAVDLTKFVAADNELELLSDNVFPDVDPQEVANDEDAKGNQFGGLETLDLHGNVLIALPLGLRRLERLTSLNLSNNKLVNDCFQVISQIPSLRDLKIGGNGLTGPLDSSITSLHNLEVLDMPRNALTALPDGLADLVRLRVLNIAENSFTSLPFEKLRGLPLTELLAAKNKLSGTLIPAEVDELPNLQILDVTSNSLTSLNVSGNLRLPVLHQLSCSCNRLTGLPDMSSWVSLLTLAAEDNNIEVIPEGFVTLPKVKNVDFNGNNLRVLDDRIGGMESLDILRVGGNPLRDKKFAGMATEDIKRALKARMAPAEEDLDKEGDGDGASSMLVLEFGTFSKLRKDIAEEDLDKEGDGDGAFYSAPVSPISPRPTTSDWPVKAGGILDRSNTQSHSLNPVAAASVAANEAVKVLELHHNIFKEIPSSIAFFAATLTTLNLAHNELTSDTFLNDDLELPMLKELNISSNTFNSVQPLIQHLKTPMLEQLDISFNRLMSLPALKQHFPRLITLLASHNTIRELSPESVRGLITLDCSSNDLNSLNARLGLLGGPGGLQKLDVTGNRFRVPKYTVLEKGTEATLAWLRDRIPAGETSPADVD